MNVQAAADMQVGELFDLIGRMRDTGSVVLGVDPPLSLRWSDLTAEERRAFTAGTYLPLSYLGAAYGGVVVVARARTEGPAS